MPRDISTNLIIEKNKLHAKYPWLLLLEFHVNDVADTVKRFVRNHENLRFLSEKYYDSGCVAHWKLDDNLATTVVLDASGNENTGTLQGGDNTEDKSVAGKVGKAFDFNGIDDYVLLESYVADIDNDDFSLSFWMYSHEQKNSIIVGPTTVDGLTVMIYNNKIALGNYGFGQTTIGDTELQTGRWYHVILTYDSSNDNTIAYLNGVNDGSATCLFTDWEKSFNQIGGHTNFWYHGILDNVQIFNRLLTADDVSLLYNLGNGTAKIPVLFTGFPFKLETITQKGGEVPTTTLRISHVTQFLQSYLENNDGCTESSVVIMLVHADNLNEDYAELTMNFDVIFPHITAKHVDFKVGCPSPLRQRFPLRRYYGDSCGIEFESARCGYTRKTVDDVTLSGTDPISIELTGHGFADEDSIRLADINGITPSLTAIFTITRTDANNFTLDDTDSSDYGGAYTSGGTAGYAFCDRIREDCRDRENETRFGGCPGLRGETIRFA